MDFNIMLSILKELPGIERVKIILCLYSLGIGCEDTMTQKECAELLNISRARVVEIEDQALFKIMEAMNDD